MLLHQKKYNFVTIESILFKKSYSFIKLGKILYELKKYIMKYLTFSNFILTLISCSSNDDNNPQTDYTIWSGDKIEFVKNGDSDPTLEANQDRITPSVAITRDNSGGEIYNIQSEFTSAKSISPVGTEWAIGTVSNIANLSFKTFRNAVGSPKDVVGKNLVMHIIEEDIYLSVEFKSWGQQKNGGFSYERSTEN